MSLTYQQIWERYSQVEFQRRIYVKRLNEDGTYEASFTEIPRNIVRDNSVSSINKSLPNNSWEFGRVEINNVRLNILSPFQEFAGEQTAGSIFAGFVRHNSIIKIVDALIDKYTDPDTPTEASVTTFEGLLDSATATTQQGYEQITVLDYMTVLSTVNVNDLTLTETTMNALIYEIMNRAEFTKYFTVSNSTTYIDAGYNATSIDTSQYDGTVLEMVEDLAKGHSIFYINPDDNTFYFKAATPTASVQFNFLEENNRKLEISNRREGIDRQITNWHWQDTSISSATVPPPVNPRPETFVIDGVTNATQRQNLLDYVLTQTENLKPYFTLKLPYFPAVELLDRVVIQHFGQAPADSARWGMSFFASSGTTNPSIAARYRKPAGIKVSADEQWMVRSVKHDVKLTTTIEVEKII